MLDVMGDLVGVRFCWSFMITFDDLGVACSWLVVGCVYCGLICGDCDLLHSRWVCFTCVGYLIWVVDWHLDWFGSALLLPCGCLCCFDACGGLIHVLGLLKPVCLGFVNFIN